MAFSILSEYFPYLPAAGRYSRRIQAGVDRRRKDDRRNKFSEALTDADLSIQTFFEVVSLSQHPDVLFLGEEYRHSYNDKYFNRDSKYQVFIDPIDGTLPYQENSERYSIIITVTLGGVIDSSIVYVPAENRGFYALRGEGAFEISDQELLAKGRGRKYILEKKHNDAGWIDVSWNSTVRAKLLAEGLKLLPESRDWDLFHRFTTASRYLTGEIYGAVFQNAQLIDGAAATFIASEAGGLLTDFKGNPLPPFQLLPTATTSELLWAIDSEVQEKLIESLRK